MHLLATTRIFQWSVRRESKGMNLSSNPQIIQLVKQNIFNVCQLKIWWIMWNILKSYVGQEEPMESHTIIWCSLFSSSLWVIKHTSGSSCWSQNQSLLGGSPEICSSTTSTPSPIRFLSETRSSLFSKLNGVASFYEAWDRFQGYLKDCTHHGYTRETLMHIFYQCIEEKYQMVLDLANRGNLANNKVIEANSLIEYLASIKQQ